MPLTLSSPALQNGASIPRKYTCESARRPRPQSPQNDLGPLDPLQHRPRHRRHPGWGGPCPPFGRHRYFFKLFALDRELTGFKKPTKAELEPAMKGHVVDKSEIVGTYAKGK